MADKCTCGHEEREHVISDAAKWGTSTSDVCDRCACHTYRRSPLSVFRGPAVSFTREEAAGWLDGLFMASVAAAIRRGESPKAWARQLVQLASYDRRRGIYPRRVALDYLAARILRAVRP